MLRFSQPLNNQPLAYAYKFTYSVACFAFVLATIFTVPLFEEDQSLTSYSFFLKASGVCMIIGEILELGVEPVPKWSVPLCAIAVLGNVLYIWSTVLY